MEHRESDFQSENFNEKFVSHCFRNSYGGRQSLASIILSRPKFQLFQWNSFRQHLICLSGSKLKDNVLKFGRFEVVRMVQIGIITWPLGPADRGPTEGRDLMLKLRDLFLRPDADNNHYDKLFLCVT